ncbi:hypothetical protein [Flavobacterium gelatinilyticum]|uniref:hypothetical protein n=1 Tax=Flavobacterium gelatinilyticum TaxID=3003260 RepID=UPI0024810E4B|nr:hypothetical protein [Flavobacterium gelatinilyticum]
MKLKNITLIAIFFTGIFSYAQQIGDGYAPVVIPDFSAPLKSGIYNGLNTSTTGMTPDDSQIWHHLFTMRHINTTNNYQLQIASSFTVNERLFFRKIAAGLVSSNTAWIELATRSTNTFTGNQIVNGNFAIGSTSANAPLDVTSNSLAQGIIVRARSLNDYSNLLFYNTSGSTGLGGIGMASSRIRIMSGGVGDSYERVSITANGLIGINSLSPLNTFEVKVPTSTGSSSSDGISIHDGATNRLGINIGVNSQNENSYLQAVKGGVGPKNIIINPVGGNVGIGTTTTGTHKLAVEGSIGAREVKVTATGWSDFVFKKEYELPTLTEVEKHIAEKGHLKDIPSEEEVLKNGINLGEMNSKLLQKIEELTLYSIQQNKKIEEQAKEIESLKSLALRIAKIENELNQK